MRCIKEKCPKHSYVWNKYCCSLDNSCSQFELKECRAGEFFKELETEFVQLKCLHDLILENQETKQI